MKEAELNNGEQAAEQEGGRKARGTWVMQQGLASKMDGRLTEPVSMEGIRQD